MFPGIPALIIDESICRRNIRNMASKVHDAGKIFRPHFKTHQSNVIGSWFREAGVDRITVSSATMAAYFAAGGWSDITIAFSANIHELDSIQKIAAETNLSILLESPEVTRWFAKKLRHETGFYIKIDTGYHRTGIEAANIRAIDQLLDATENSGPLKFKGFLTHAGHTYHASSAEIIGRIRDESVSRLNLLKDHYIARFPGLILSYGDTPSCSLETLPEPIDEFRPGNFVFYDSMQFCLGSCSLADIAVAVRCPVVSVHYSRKEAVIYGGSVHLSKDSCLLQPDSRPAYGIVVAENQGIWDTAAVLGHIRNLSQEHGIIELTQRGCNLQPGDWVAVLPAHSCLTASMYDTYHTTAGNRLPKMRW